MKPKEILIIDNSHNNKKKRFNNLTPKNRSNYILDSDDELKRVQRKQARFREKYKSL